jgi:hypothetical protein
MQGGLAVGRLRDPLTLRPGDTRVRSCQSHRPPPLAPAPSPNAIFFINRDRAHDSGIPDIARSIQLLNEPRPNRHCKRAVARSPPHNGRKPKRGFSGSTSLPRARLRPCPPLTASMIIGGDGPTSTGQSSEFRPASHLKVAT